MLSRDYLKSVVMAVAQDENDGILQLKRVGAITMPDQTWRVLGAGMARRNGAGMVYRNSWLAGLAALAFAFAKLNGLILPTETGVQWQYIVPWLRSHSAS